MGPADFKWLSQNLSGPALLVTDLTGHEDYCHDATEDSGTPSAIVFAEYESDVIATLRFCAAHDLPVVPRGAGTGLSGGCVPSRGGIVLSTERMKQLEIDPENRTAVCGPGVITKALVDTAGRFGLTYPPDPASYDESTLGGNVAEGAGGLRCKRFGVTKDYVIGLTAVTADGRIIKTGRQNGYQGFSLGDLFVGSEGTLVVITQIVVRLIVAPSPGNTLLIAFDDPADAARTVSEITGSGLIPTVLEYLDGDAADCSNRYEKHEGLDRVAAILLIETAGEDRSGQTGTIGEICRKNKCSYLRVESDPDKAERLWAVRRNLSNAMKAIAKYRISEDVAVPNSQFPRLVAFVAELNEASPLRINAYGHAGDGNLHVNFMSMSGSAAEIRLMQDGIGRLLRKTVELGGTLTGEHGIGLAKRHYLPLEFDGPTLHFMKRVKSLFDPTDLLNPGKIFQKNEKL
ncbi:MAG: FAD-binding protein [candidate division Zixibacteria bacterium]|nr:FAD-binding protein [candidate division Zixibacteria bacterium]